MHRAVPALAVALGVLTFLSGVLSGCGDEPDDLPCVAVSTDCRPIVSPPTFDALYTNILQKSCAQATGRCHNASVAGGLDMRTPDSAFDGLSKRADPKNLGCSLLIRRVEAASASVRMPPGPTPLTDAQRCAIRQWVANGAQR